MIRVLENNKLDLAMLPVALNNTNKTGDYFSMSGKSEALFMLQVASMAAAKTAKLEIYQAKDSGGTDAEVVQDKDGTSLSALITANTSVIEGTVDVTSADDTDEVIVNGITFTKASATSITSKYFADADGLAENINLALQKLVAEAAANVVTITSDEPGEELVTISKTEKAGTITVATTKANAYISFPVEYMKEGFSHLAAKVTTTANTVASVVLLSGNPSSYNPEQKVSAYNNITCDSF